MNDVLEGQSVALREYLGDLTQYLELPGVTDVCINRPGEVWTKGAKGWQKHFNERIDFKFCYQLAKLVANYNQQSINTAAPRISAVIPGELRIEIIIPPALENNTIAIAIRRPLLHSRTLEQYDDEGAFDEFTHSDKNELSDTDRELTELLTNNQLMEFFRTAIRARKNIAVLGNTGSGKTTLMRSMCEVIPPSERLITIEDVHELILPHENRLHLLYSATGEGASKVTPAELIRSCMRLQPDRVLLAELRGSEAFDFLGVLASGHSGAITSFHAKNCAGAIDRFVDMCNQHPKAALVSEATLRRSVASSVDVFVHMRAIKQFDANGAMCGQRRIVDEVRFNPKADA